MAKSIGKPINHWVSIDSPGVPQGGPYGRVEWFAEKCEKVGLKLVWSWRHYCFMAVQKCGPRWVTQEIFARGLGANQRILHLDENSFALLLWLWRRALMTPDKRAFMVRHQIEADYQARLEREWREIMEANRRERLSHIELLLGRTPNVMVLPKHIVSKHGRDAAKRRKAVRKRRMVLLPHEVN